MVPGGAVVSAVDVLFFASLRDEVGCDRLSIALEEPVSLDGLIDALKARLSAEGFAAVTGERVRIALNQELIQGPCRICPGDELAFLPPVTGG